MLHQKGGSMPPFVLQLSFYHISLQLRRTLQPTLSGGKSEIPDSCIEGGKLHREACTNGIHAAIIQREPGSNDGNSRLNHFRKQSFRIHRRRVVEEN